MYWTRCKNLSVSSKGKSDEPGDCRDAGKTHNTEQTGVHEGWIADCHGKRACVYGPVPGQERILRLREEIILFR